MSSAKQRFNTGSLPQIVVSFHQKIKHTRSEMGVVLVSNERILELKAELLPVREAVEAFRDEAIRAFAREALEKAPDGFWLSPASSSGKYHPPFDQVTPCGLVNHSLVATLYVEEGIRRYPFFTYDNYRPKPMWLDRARAAALLHDIAKSGIPWGDHTVGNHGHLGAEFLAGLESFAALDKISQWAITAGVRWHMGRWEEGYDPYRGAMSFERLIQEADYYSTRKWTRIAGITLINYPLPLGGG